MRGRVRVLAEHEALFWLDAMRSVRRLRAAAPPAAAATIPPPPAPVAPVPVPALASPSAPAARAAIPPLVIGTRGLGLDDTSWRALDRGRLPAGRRLDLHGHDANAALAALEVFLSRASLDGVRCVEVVTGLGSGEGGGVLRRELPHWLNRPELRRLVVAAAPSRPGNPGALRLILRRR